MEQKIAHFIEYNKLFIECLELINNKAICTSKTGSYLYYKFNEYFLSVNENYFTHSITLHSYNIELLSYKKGYEINELKKIIEILSR